MMFVCLFVCLFVYLFVCCCFVLQYVREVFRLLGDDMAYRELGEQSLEYAIVWIHFVLDKCDRGRGTRPRSVKKQQQQFKV